MTFEPHPGPRHLAPDDYDAWRSGALSPEAAAHLEGCPDCLAVLQAEQEMMEELAGLPLLTPRPDFAERVITTMRTEQQMDALLGALPLFSPSQGFADRVIARVIEPRPGLLEVLRSLPSRALATRKSMAIAASAAVALVGSLTWSVLWSLAHRDAMHAFGTALLAGLREWLLAAFRTGTATVMQQPWYDTVRDLLATPGRAAAVGVLALALYVGGLLALRRLITAPGERMTHAV